MAPQEIMDVAGQLESAREELIVFVSSLTDEQARMRPAPDRWSVFECLEHVSFVERRFLGMVKQSEPATPAERDAAKEAALSERVMNRSTKRTAPEAVHPTGKYDLSRSASRPALGPLNGVEA